MSPSPGEVTIRRLRATMLPILSSSTRPARAGAAPFAVRRTMGAMDEEMSTFASRALLA